MPSIKRLQANRGVNRRKSRGAGNGRADIVLFSVIGALVIWGVLTVGAISFPFSLSARGTPWHYLLHQLVMIAIGIGAGIVCYKLPIEKLKKAVVAAFFINLALLLLVFAPKIGMGARGATRWISLGGFSFQPSEFLKLTFILYLAAWLAGKEKAKEKSRSLKVLLPFIVILSVLVIALLFQPDMSTLGIIGLAGIVMYFSSPNPWWHTALLLSAGVSGFLLLIKTTPYRLARLLVFLEPDKDPLGIGYQLRQCLIALGSGKLLGFGDGFSFGLSRQKFGFVPHPMTDSIFAIIGEELGFIGAVILIALFLLLAYRGITIAFKSEQTFNKLTALGITFWFTFQALFNISGIIGILPLGGVPLTFFSYGGSHIIAELAAVGILLNLSKNI